MANLPWPVVLFIVISQLRVTCVTVTFPTDSVYKPNEKASQSGRPCPDKFRQVGNHTACRPPSAQSMPLELGAEDVKLIVETHNRYRSSVNPPATNMLHMTWDDEIAMIAQAWAETCSLEHDEAKNRDIPGRLSLGQNVGEGVSTWTAVIDAWFMEAQSFTYGDDNNVFEETGHYTQGVWADSSKLGCGASSCGNIIFYVCNYGPAGNIEPLNQPYKAGDSCSECSMHCEHNLCACGDAVCENGGTMIRESCQCHCRHRWLVERQCKLNCSAVSQPGYCGRKPFDRKGCHLYENVPYDCPTTCHICPPDGDGDHSERSTFLPPPENNNNNNDKDNNNNNKESSGGDDTSAGTAVHRWQHLLCVFFLCLWGRTCC